MLHIPRILFVMCMMVGLSHSAYATIVPNTDWGGRCVGTVKCVAGTAIQGPISDRIKKVWWWYIPYCTFEDPVEDLIAACENKYPNCRRDKCHIEIIPKALG